MAEFWRTKSFKVLSIEWKRKLEESGFKDVEVQIKDDRALKQRATNCYGKASQLERESRLEYFCFLGYLAQNTKFPNALEKFVMVRHSEGATTKEIVDELNLRGTERHRQTVQFIIRRWQMKWGLRSWSLKQMNLKK